MDWVSRMLPDYGYGPMTAATRRGQLQGTPDPQFAGTGDLRSGNTPLGDAAAETLGPWAGPLASALGRGAETAGQVGAELTMIPQARRAGDAWSKVMDDPTLAGITNAGAQSAMALLRPMAAAKIVGGGLGIGAARDVLGMPESTGLIPEAQAAGKKGQASSTDELPNGYKKTELETIAQQIGMPYDQLAAMKRRQVQDLVSANANNVMAGKAKAAEAKGLADQAEYERAVKAAETARDAELAQNRRFSKTEVGKVWEATGGLAPFAAGAGAGAITRAATGPAKSVWERVGLPIAAGAGAGMTAVNVPLYYDAFQTDRDNPVKRGYEVYARELPPGHPRKQEAADLAAGMPARNPIQQAAEEDFRNGFMTRNLGGAFEGGLSGLVGSEAAQMLSRAVPSVVTGAAALPAKTRAAVADAEGRATAATLRRDRAVQALRAERADAAGAQADAAEFAAKSAEAQGRIGAGTGALGPGQPASAVSPPSPASVPNRPTLPPPNSPLTNYPPMGPSPAQGEQNALSEALDRLRERGLTVNVPDAFTQAIADLGKARTATPVPALPPPNAAPLNPGTVYGPAQSDAVRAAIEGHMSSPGATIRRGARQDKGGFTSGMGVQAMREAGVPAIDERQMSTRLGALVRQVGPTPTQDALLAQWASDPGRTVLSVAAPAAAVGISADPVLRALFGLAPPPAPEPTGFDAAMQRILAQQGVH